jgi:hypothetical protein
VVFDRGRHVEDDIRVLNVVEVGMSVRHEGVVVSSTFCGGEWGYISCWKLYGRPSGGKH